MGDAADMLLDGLICQHCFEIIDGDAPGRPRWCARCRLAGYHNTDPVILKELADD